MAKHTVVWRKEGSLQFRTVEGSNPLSAWDAFKALKLGGGIPVSGTVEQTSGEPVARVLNGEGKCLALVIEGVAGSL